MGQQLSACGPASDRRAYTLESLIGRAAKFPSADGAIRKKSLRDSVCRERSRMIPLSDDNPTQRSPVVTGSLIFVCLVVFAWQLSVSERDAERVIETFGFTPASLLPAIYRKTAASDPWAWATILTSMFLHGGFLHLGGNMLYLWIFGNNVEEAMGRGRFVCFYFTCGIMAALAQAFSEPNSLIPMVGASGAISGVLASYAVIFPRARVNVVIPVGIIFYPLKISAIYVIGFWFLLQLPNLLFGTEGLGGTAWWAHVGGFLTGLVLTPLFSRFPLFGRHTRRL
jgi:membrane associated rhomboid family serine protease